MVWFGREVLDVQTDDRWGLRHGRGRERRRCCRRGRRPSMARLAGEERHVSDLQIDVYMTLGARRDG